MHQRPTVLRAQTSKQAKADYKKYGPRISTQEARHLKRGSELFERAEKLKDRERRSKITRDKRTLKDQREREARRNQGLPSQPPPKVAASQTLLNGFVKKSIMADGRTPWIRSNATTLEISTSPCHQRHERMTQAGSTVTASQQPPSSGVSGDHWDESDDAAMIATSENLPDSTSLDDATTGGSNSEEEVDFTSDDGQDLHDSWDDFVSSNTQVQHEICNVEPQYVQESRASLSFVNKQPEQTAQQGNITAQPNDDIDLNSLLSTQDISLSMGDLEELEVSPYYRDEYSQQPRANETTSEEQDRALMPPPPPPQRLSRRDPVRATMDIRTQSGNIARSPPEALSTHLPVSTPSGSLRDALSMCAVEEPFEDDFILSTQDKREIDCI